MFKADNKNTRKRCEICSKLTMKTPERRHVVVSQTEDILSRVGFFKSTIQFVEDWIHLLTNLAKSPLFLCSIKKSVAINLPSTDA